MLDAYHGLFRIDLDTCDPLQPSKGPCAVRHIFNGHINLHLPEALSRPSGRLAGDEGPLPNLYAAAPKFFNDFDISSTDGCVYFTDSSYKWSRSNNRYISWSIYTYIYIHKLLTNY